MEIEKMGTIGILAIFLSSSLCLYFVLALIGLYTNYGGILFTYNIECVYRESQVLLTDSSMEATMKFWTWKAKPRTGLWVYHMTWCPKFSLIFTHGSTNMVTKKKKPLTMYILLNLIVFHFLTFPHPFLSLWCREDLSSMVWHSTSTGHYRTTAYQRDAE